MKILVSLMALMSFSAMASTVAIIDSGTDLNHEQLIDKIWTNPTEVPQNSYDDDGNGYVDDYHGWNFAENNNLLIDYKYGSYLNDDVKKFFDLQAKALTGEASDADIAWLKKMYQDEKFIKHLTVYANYMHGTHVAGIASKGSDDITVLPIKLIPTEVKLPFSLHEKGIGATLFRWGLDWLAAQQMKSLKKIATYVGSNGADVANGSFGTGYNQAKKIVEPLYKVVNFWRRDLPDEQREKEIHGFTIDFLNALLKYGREMADAAPKTLFVFAAGNDGMNNDEFPTSPAGVKAPNVITVAATFGRKMLASFSNYGQSVDVAAPGVNILSSVPDNHYLRVSGTSQAAPYVAHLAADIKDANPELAPVQIKKILMGTVDKKAYLEGKVKSAGIVNPDRAVYAASLSKSMHIDKAIKQAKMEIADYAEDKGLMPSDFVPYVIPLPTGFKL